METVTGGSFSKVLTAPVNPDGSLGTWVVESNLPTDIPDCMTFVVKNKAYYIAADVVKSGPTNLSSVYKANITGDGNLGPWKYVHSIPYNITKSSVVVTSSRVYIIGGVHDTVTLDRVIYSEIGINGELKNWTVDIPFPINVKNHVSVVIKDRVYIIGGSNLEGVKTSIYYAIITKDGIITNYVLYSNLPETVQQVSAFVTKNKLYLIAGRWMDDPNSSKIYAATINSDGSLGSFTNTSNLPTGAYGSTVFALNGKLYVAGGYKDDAISNRVDIVTIAGGLNDYTPYYGDAVNTATPSSFYLPDFTALERNKLYFFIKT